MRCIGFESFGSKEASSSNLFWRLFSCFGSPSLLDASICEARAHNDGDRRRVRTPGRRLSGVLRPWRRDRTRRKDGSHGDVRCRRTGEALGRRRRTRAQAARVPRRGRASCCSESQRREFRLCVGRLRGQGMRRDGTSSGRWDDTGECWVQG